jgi:hypothetical protein
LVPGAAPEAGTTGGAGITAGRVSPVPATALVEADAAVVWLVI